jgi:hypothetical protein
LGIPDMRMLNICLLASWVQRYYDDEDKLWRKSIDCKYQPSVPNIFSCGMDPPFEKECCGMPRQQKRVLSGRLDLGRRLDSGSTIGL